MLVTTLVTSNNHALRITDFCPRYIDDETNQLMTPCVLARHVQAIRGHPRVRCRLRPAIHYGSQEASRKVATEQATFDSADAPGGFLFLSMDTDIVPAMTETPFLAWQESFFLFGTQRYGSAHGTDESLKSVFLAMLVPTDVLGY